MRAYQFELKITKVNREESMRADESRRALKRAEESRRELKRADESKSVRTKDNQR
jgi:hypothetical protein